jgi:hypothetical protein
MPGRIRGSWRSFTCCCLTPVSTSSYPSAHPNIWPHRLPPSVPIFPARGNQPRQLRLFFKPNPHAVLLCAFLQFGAAIPLGIFAATIGEPAPISRSPRGRCPYRAVRWTDGGVRYRYFGARSLGHGLPRHRSGTRGATRNCTTSCLRSVVQGFPFQWVS